MFASLLGLGRTNVGIYSSPMGRPMGRPCLAATPRDTEAQTSAVRACGATRTDAPGHLRPFGPSQSCFETVWEGPYGGGAPRAFLYLSLQSKHDSDWIHTIHTIQDHQGSQLRFSFPKMPKLCSFAHVSQRSFDTPLAVSPSRPVSGPGGHLHRRSQRCWWLVVQEVWSHVVASPAFGRSRPPPPNWFGKPSQDGSEASLC